MVPCSEPLGSPLFSLLMFTFHLRIFAGLNIYPRNNYEEVVFYVYLAHYSYSAATYSISHALIFCAKHISLVKNLVGFSGRYMIESVIFLRLMSFEDFTIYIISISIPYFLFI